uniref:Uncharacterized protein n=1 Tax=Arundo donax TaxID=35708 RepID=A0A0A9D177_ARUDO
MVVLRKEREHHQGNQLKIIRQQMVWRMLPLSWTFQLCLLKKESLTMEM